MVSDKMIHKDCRTRATLYLKQNPLEKFFIFTYLPKLHVYIGFNIVEDRFLKILNFDVCVV